MYERWCYIFRCKVIYMYIFSDSIMIEIILPLLILMVAAADVELVKIAIYQITNVLEYKLKCCKIKVYQRFVIYSITAVVTNTDWTIFLVVSVHWNYMYYVQQTSYVPTMTQYYTIAAIEWDTLYDRIYYLNVSISKQKDNSCVGNYRPITILSFVFKCLLHKFIHLQVTVLLNDSYSNNGFRK